MSTYLDDTSKGCLINDTWRALASRRVEDVDSDKLQTVEMLLTATAGLPGDVLIPARNLTIAPGKGPAPDEVKLCANCSQKCPKALHCPCRTVR